MRIISKALLGKLVRFARSHYPECFGIRKCCQRIKLKRIFKRTLSENDVRKCELNENLKGEVIAPYLKKWHKYLIPTYAEINDILTKSPLFKDGTYDKEAIKTDMLFCRLAYGFIPSEYISFGFFNKTPQERRAFCSDLYTTYFGYSVNHMVAAQNIIDKAKNAQKFKPLFRRDIFIIDKKANFDDFLKFTQSHPMFVKKNICSSMGKGVELVDVKNIENLEEFFGKLRKDKWLLEELVIQSSYMKQLHHSSVNTIRCMTFKTKDGIVVPYCILRTGRNGSFVDNGGSGGLLTGVNTKTGIAETDAYDEYGVIFSEHPNTNIKFKGFQIPDWDDMINICKNAAEKETQMGYLSFDMAHTDNGWVVIEVNTIGQLVLAQTVYQKGIQEDIDRYLKDMKKFI